MILSSFSFNSNEISKHEERQKNEEEVKLHPVDCCCCCYCCEKSTTTAYDIYFVWVIENANPKNIQSKFINANILAVVKSFQRNMRAFIIESAFKSTWYTKANTDNDEYIYHFLWKMNFHFIFSFSFLFFSSRHSRCLSCGSSEEKILQWAKMMSLTKVFLLFVQWFNALHWVELYSKEFTVKGRKTNIVQRY